METAAQTAIQEQQQTAIRENGVPGNAAPVRRLDQATPIGAVALLPLDLPERSVCWKNSEGVVRTHVFRRITERHWNGYFSRMVFETDQTSRTIDVNSAALWLYGECIVRAEGYTVKGGGDLLSLPNWRERIPMGHRLQAVNLLAAVERSADGCNEIEPDCEVVNLDATWGVDLGQQIGDSGLPAIPRTMLKYSGLVHRFSSPTADQMMRYSRESSRSLIVGGSMKGKTIHAIRQKVLLKLYDELIQGVEGYAVGGTQLAERSEIAREMDAFHKIAAAGVLFSVAAEESGEDAGEE